MFLASRRDGLRFRRFWYDVCTALVFLPDAILLSAIGEVIHTFSVLLAVLEESL